VGGVMSGKANKYGLLRWLLVVCLVVYSSGSFDCVLIIQTGLVDYFRIPYIVSLPTY